MQILSNIVTKIRSLFYLNRSAAIEHQRIPPSELMLDVSALNLSTRARNALATNSIVCVGQLAQMKPRQVTSLEGVGQKTFAELMAALTERGLRFGMQPASLIRKESAAVQDEPQFVTAPSAPPRHMMEALEGKTDNGGTFVLPPNAKWKPLEGVRDELPNLESRFPTKEVKE